MRYTYKQPIFYVRPATKIIRRIVGEIHFPDTMMLVADDDTCLSCDLLDELVRRGTAELVRSEDYALRLVGCDIVPQRIL